MARGREIKIFVTGDTKDAERAFRTVSGKAQGLSQKFASVGRSMSLGVTAPILGIGAASIKAFGEAEKVAAQTTAAIRSTGGAAGKSAGDIAEIAKSLSQVTAFEDETIASTENLLLTFTNIKGDAFDAATRAALDMSQALGQDTKSSAMQLGKALNDPIKGVTALSRVGVTFTKQQKAQIETLVKSGDTMGAQKVILGELSKEFGGSAKEFAKTSAGQTKKALNDLGNAAESFGAILAPIVTQVAGVVTKIAGAFQNLSPEAQKMIAVFGGVAAAVGPILVMSAKVVQSFGVVKDALKGVKLATLGTFGIWAIAIAAVVALAVVIVKNWDTIKKFLLGVWEGLKKAAKAAFEFIKNVFLNSTPLGLIIKHWDTIKNTVLGVWRAVKNSARAAWDFVVSKIRGAIEKVKAIVDGAKKVFDKLAFWRHSPSQLEVNAQAATDNTIKIFQKFRDNLDAVTAKSVNLGEIRMPDRFGRAYGDDFYGADYGAERAKRKPKKGVDRFGRAPGDPFYGADYGAERSAKAGAVHITINGFVGTDKQQMTRVIHKALLEAKHQRGRDLGLS